jgi:hypothetical protein
VVLANAAIYLILVGIRQFRMSFWYGDQINSNNKHICFPSFNALSMYIIASFFGTVSGSGWVNE